MSLGLALGLALVAVDVAGDVTCPAPPDVSRLLVEMAPAAAGDRTADQHHVRLSRDGGGLHVRLLDPRDQQLAERDLPAAESCADLAHAVAIVIAAWEADLDPRITAQVTLPPPASRSEQPTAVVQVTQAAAPPAPPLSWDLGLALIGSVTGGQAAPGARIGGWIAPGGWHMGLGLTVSGVTARSAPVGAYADAARWSRVAFGAGPEARFDVGRTILAARAQGVAALLSVEGVGLSTTAASSSSQLGASLGVQAGRPWGNATPWVGLDVLVWPGRDRLEITGLADQGQIPRFELQLALGLSLGRMP
ncbi:MAG TPA: hypothetical protein VMT03_14100 [Polyangia bacterium]|nr:hypothetical protein [Polyangia bacterium]